MPFLLAMGALVLEHFRNILKFSLQLCILVTLVLEH